MRTAERASSARVQRAKQRAAARETWVMRRYWTLDPDGHDRLAWAAYCPGCRCWRDVSPGPAAAVGTGTPGADGACTPESGVASVVRDIGALPLTEVMTREVVCVRPEASLETLVDLFELRRVSGVPVIDDAGRLVGVVSKSDALRAWAEPEAWELSTPPSASTPLIALDEDELSDGYRAELVPRAVVSEIMTPSFRALPESATLGDAARIMAQESIHRVLVLAPNGELAGVVSALDLAHAIARSVSRDMNPATGTRGCPAPRCSAPRGRRFGA